MIKAVIFDKDGVIVDTEKAHLDAWNTTLKNYGIVVTPELYQKLFAGRKAEQIVEKLLGQRLNKDQQSQVLEKKVKALIRIFEKDIKIVPGVIEFIQKIKNRQIPLALATGSRTETTNFILNKIGLKNYFDVIVTAQHIKLGKPDPEVFLLAAAKLHVFPGECVVFEDSLQGVESAKRAGMKVVLVTTSHQRHQIPHEVDMDIPDFTKIAIDDLLKL